MILACAEPDREEPAATAGFGSPAEAADLDDAGDVLHVALTADELTFEVAGRTIDGYAYDGQVPGPTLRATGGDTLIVDFANALDASTTIHWHGVHAPNDMDGVTWLAAPIPAGSSYTYTIPLDRAGTFWYHPHVDTDRQVDLGLYGLLVVEDPDDPPMDELLVVFDTWGEVESDEHGLPDPGRTTWTANGVVQPAFEHDGPVRVRTLNASNTGYLALSGVGTRIGGDQGILDTSDTSGEVLLAPGDRAEVEWTGDIALTNAPYTLAGAALGDPEVLMTASTSGSGAAWPFAEQGPSPDPGTTDIVYVLAGGTDGDTWLINGEAYPEVTVESLALGQDAVIEVRNLSATEHPFHVHGHSFEVLSVDGVPPAARTIEDTVNVRIRETLRLRMVADNPGEWMVHCHLLGHEEGGMMTVLAVE